MRFDQFGGPGSPSQQVTFLKSRRGGQGNCQGRRGCSRGLLHLGDVTSQHHRGCVGQRAAVGLDLFALGLVLSMASRYWVQSCGACKADGL